MADDYIPIETKADRREARFQRINEGIKEILGIKGSWSDHFDHRLSLKTIFKESWDHFTQKVIPHGANEIGNALYGSSGYLPWPGQGGPEPIPAPDPVPSYGVHGPLQTEESSNSLNAYMTGNYKAENNIDYDAQIDAAAQRGSSQDTGLER